MKKLAIVAFGVALVAGAAMANSITVPFWSDQTGAIAPGSPAAARYTFIGIYNSAATARTLIFTYTDDEIPGVSRTPTANTFILQGGSGISFRPNASDPALEGAGSAIPDFVPPDSGHLAGSLKISWNGGAADDIKGRVVQVFQVAGETVSFGYGMNL